MTPPLEVLPPKRVHSMKGNGDEEPHEAGVTRLHWQVERECNDDKGKDGEHMVHDQESEGDREREDNVKEEVQAASASWVVGAVVFVVYCRTMYPTVPGGDSGELIVAGCTMGIAHPPGSVLDSAHLFAGVACRLA